MAIDWQAEVAKRKDDLLNDLKTMLEIESVRDESIATADAPLGPGPKAALDKFLEIGKRDGFETMELDGLAGHIAYGQGDETLAILGHVDVMPAGKGWDTDPFKPVIKDGRLYARGASDDKGPSMAAYYGLKIVKELGLPVNKKVRFILGTDEESQWRGMSHYFEKMPAPDFGFSPDAFFPIINGEKGNITEYLHFAGENDGAFQLLSFKAGLRDNMVPESATATFTANSSLADLQDKLAAFTSAEGLTAELTQDGDVYRVTLIGKSAHGSTPEAGINGATYLATFLNQFDFAGAAKAYLNVTANVLHRDFAGKKLGVAYTDAKMGALSMNAGVFTFDRHSDDNTITLNFRYPQGTTPQAIKEQLETLEGVTCVTLSDHEHTPHYVPADDPLVATLLSVYEKQTGLKGYEQVIGGGTFGRLLERGVAFGAMFPGYVNTMHQANEFADVEDLYRAAAIYAEAIYELIK